MTPSQPVDSPVTSGAIPVLALERRLAVSRVLPDDPRFRALLDKHGAILLRDGSDEPLEAISASAASVLGAPAPYEFFVTPRRALPAGFLTATEVPPARHIRFHHECSYLPAMPRYILFACEKPAERGGRTLFARARDVTAHLPTELLSRFRERQLRYTWTLRAGPDLLRRVGVTVTEVGVQRLRALGFEVESTSRGDILARSLRPAIMADAEGHRVWMNHLWAMHRSGIPAVVAEVHAREFCDNLPSHDVTFDDGSPIDDSDVAAVGAAYTPVAAVAWQAGDVVVVDNTRWAHAREPFTGTRRLAVQFFGRHDAEVP
jgi:hypothetical protein